MDKTLKEKLNIVEIADVEALFDALTPWDKIEFIRNHVDILDEEWMGREMSARVLAQQIMPRKE